MKILIDLTSLHDNFSGIERYAAEMCKEITENREHNFVLVFKGEIFPSLAYLKEKNNVETVILKPCNKLLFYQIRLCRFINRYNADVFFFPAFPVPIFLKKKKKIVATVHDLCCWDCPETMNFKSKLYFRLGIKREVKKCKKIFTVSEFSKNRIVEKFGIPEEKVIVTYNGISESFNGFKTDFEVDKAIDAKYGLPEKFILSLSTIEPRKNIRLLLNAYSELIKSGSVDCDLVLAGRDGWKNSSLMTDIDEEVKRRIHFTGFIDEEHLPYIYNRAELFVFPSIYEGFGIPPLEAMACRTMVVSSDAASLPEVLGDAAIYFESNNKEDLLKKIVNAISLNNKDEYLDKGQETVSKYSWTASAEKFLENLSHI